MNDIRPAQPSKPAVPPAVPPRRFTSLAPLSSLPKLSLNTKSPKRRRWLVLAIAAGLVLLSLVGFIVGRWWYAAGLEPLSSRSTHIKVVVTKGEGVGQVADDLQRAGVIRNSLAMQLYVHLHGLAYIQAGTYMFSPSQTVREIVDWLNLGRVDTFRVTILPGRTLSNIKQELIDQGFAAADVDAALAAHYDAPLLATKPADVGLEGYIFPETYFMDASATPADVLRRSFAEFQKQIDDTGLAKPLADRGLNLHQAITLASIVSGEATNPTDQRQIAQVFEHRLDIGMMLGSDITYMYAAKLLGVAPSPDINSPYNTRKFGGFPPGPVSNFNIGALEAVAHPASGTYLFFVAGDDGTVHYAYTEDEHNANVARYCHKLCRQ